MLQPPFRRLIRLVLLIVILIVAIDSLQWRTVRSWPDRFTEVRALIPDGDGLLVAVGDANPPHVSELWRYNGSWVLVKRFDGFLRVLDTVRYNGHLCAALGTYHTDPAADIRCRRNGRWYSIRPVLNRQWIMTKRLIVHDGDLWAFMMQPGRGGSPVWRLHRGKWHEIPSPFPLGVYQATVYRGRIIAGSLGPPVRLAVLENGTWRILKTFDAAEIESFTERDGVLYFTIGREPDQAPLPAVWTYDGTSIAPLDVPEPALWRGNNNFNASIVWNGELIIASSGYGRWPSLWRLRNGKWRLLGGWPWRRKQWIYDLAIWQGRLLCSFAGVEGAAAVVALP